MSANIVHVTVSGLTGTGKSAVMGEIEIALKAIGVTVEHGRDFQAEKSMTHADWQTALDLYKPTVVLREINTPTGTGTAPTDADALIARLWGSLNFILAFYEPGQRYLDTEAWKQAEASGRRSHADARAYLDALAKAGAA